MATKKIKYRNPRACPNCGQDRDSLPYAEDINPYSYGERDDYPHERIIDCIIYLRQELEDTKKRLDDHNL
jgi:hypothetical protein